MSEAVSLSDPMLLALQLALQFAPADRTRGLLKRAEELDEREFLRGKAEAVAQFLRVVQDGMTFGKWP